MKTATGNKIEPAISVAASSKAAPLELDAIDEETGELSRTVSIIDPSAFPFVQSSKSTRSPGFRGRRPKELAFGTGGLRGLVKDITDLEAYINARGFLEHALQVGEITPGRKVSLAGDLRPSTDGPERKILRAAAQAVVDAGLQVEYLGHVPTPTLTFYSFQRKRPSIMVTGSHAPFDRNGMKFFLGSGELLKDDESAIQRAIEKVRAREYSLPERLSLFSDDGMFKSRLEQPLLDGNPQACFDYLCRYLNFLPHDALEGMRIIFYQHSAVGRDLLMVLLVSLGADVIPAGRSDGFMPVDTESLSKGTGQLLQGYANQAVRQYGHVDAIMSTDGDSDRPLLATISPEGQVRLCSGDLLGIVTANFLNADTVVVPINTNDAVDRWAVARGTAVLKTKIGSPHVVEAMQEARMQGAKRVVGWESNGGFLTATDIERKGRTLAALPSRDAALPLLAALSAAKERRLSLSGLFGELPQRFIKMGATHHFPIETSRSMIQRFLPSQSGIEDVVFSNSFVSLRHTNGRIETAGADAAAMYRENCRQLETFFSPEDGFDQVLRINGIDGLRVWFANGDIAHIRPSGTGPQLRVYAVADTQARADKIIARTLRQPDGILRLMENNTHP